jgi:hypothetical protein
MPPKISAEVASRSGLDRYPLQGQYRGEPVAAHQHRSEPVLVAGDHVGDPQRLLEGLADLRAFTGRPRRDCG